MPFDPHIVIHRWFDEVWNQGREETIDELFPADGIAYGLGEAGSEVRGPAAFKVFWNNMRTAIPDVHIRIEDTIVEGEKAVVRVVLKGTHLGEGLGLAPTGRPVSFSGIVIVKVISGQIVEGWQNWDQLGLLQQVGAVPSPQAEDRFLTARV